MPGIKDLYKSGDWKAEKHVPVIDAPDSAAKGKSISVTVSVGKEIAHPNTTEHHISWIEVYFHPEGGKFPYQIGRYDFTAHGASTDGPNTSAVYAEPDITVHFKSDKPGVIYSTAYCNIHGLWENSKTIAVV